MSGRALALACGLLLVCGSLLAQPPGCTHEGDAAFRFGWGMTYAGWSGYIPPPGHYNLVAVNGPDTTWGPPGGTLVYKLGPYNATAWQPQLCTAQDTFCFDVSSTHGWTIVCNPVAGTAMVLPAGGYLWTQNVTIQIPCNATIGSYEMVVAGCYYANSLGACDPTCLDCADPNTRPLNNTKFYSKDTLYVRVNTPHPTFPPVILQDTLSFAGEGMPQRDVPFSLCNQDPCLDVEYGYHIWSMGHIGGAISTYDTVAVSAGKCTDVYGIINTNGYASGTLDTLHIVAWTLEEPALYDTCVQRLLIIALCGTCPVPLLTAPVVAILALALILAAALFMRRRAASRP